MNARSMRLRDFLLIAAALLVAAPAFADTLLMPKRDALKGTSLVIWGVTSWLSFSLVHAQNTGAAFGVMDGQKVFFIVFTIVAVGLLGYMLKEVPDEDRFQATAIGLILSGAVGNLIDRIRLGWVTDFIKIPHWPAFNVADIAVTLGVVVLVFVLEKASK